jgi:vacuolar iron transporter family protein
MPSNLPVAGWSSMVEHAPTHHHVVHPHAEPHRSNRSGWLRAAVLGANDGVVSTACLIGGVAGAGASYSAVRTAGIAGLAAGALSMALGEYVSVASQRDIEQADLRIESKALEEHPAAELRELAQIWELRGVQPDLAMEVARQLTAKDALAAHARDELGLTEDTAARPVQASLASAVAFTLGALVPLVAFLLAPDDGRSVVVFSAAVAALLALGWLGAVLGSAKRLRAMARVGVGGAAAMAITVLIGELTGAALG